MRAGIGWSRVDPGAPIQDQESDSGDRGKCDEFDPEDPVRLVRDGEEDRDEQHRDEQGKGLRRAVSELRRLSDDAGPNRDCHEQQAGQARRRSPSDRRECAPFLQPDPSPLQPRPGPTTVMSEEPTDDRLCAAFEPTGKRTVPDSSKAKHIDDHRPLSPKRSVCRRVGNSRAAPKRSATRVEATFPSSMWLVARLHRGASDCL